MFKHNYGKNNNQNIGNIKMAQNKHEKIRIISETLKGERFAVAAWKNNIQIWDIQHGLISTFTADVVSGMRDAISISEDGQQLVVAGYDQNTVTLYDTENGKIIWQLRDIKKPSTVLILKFSENLIYIDSENRGAFLLDRKTGDTIEKLKDIEFIRESPYSNVDQFEKKESSFLVNRADRTITKKLKHKSFAMLDATFSKDKFICSYSGMYLEAISLTTFETNWTTSVIGHFLEIEYSEELNKILGIRWEYEKGSPKFLCYINNETGRIEKEINLGEPVEIKFLKQGSFMLTSQGKLYSTLTGKQVKQFNFEKYDETFGGFIGESVQP